MIGYIYWGGYLASFVVFSIMSIVECRREAKAGESSSNIIDHYAKYILMACLLSFLSWVMWVFVMGYVIIFAGVKSE